MLGHKHPRKNHYKTSVTKKRDNSVVRLTFCLKIFAGIVIVTVTSFAFIFGYDLLTQCEYFSAKNLDVKGIHRLSEKQIFEQAQIHKGINILCVNLSMARKRLLAHSWIAAAEVRRELPDGIYIKIKEHAPLAVLDLGRKFLINTEGEIFKECSASDPENLPIISGLEFSDLNIPGKRRPPRLSDPAATSMSALLPREARRTDSGQAQSKPFDAVLYVLQLGQKSESILPNRLIKRIHVDREIGLTLYAFDGIKAIKLGYQEYPDKYVRLKNVLFYLKKSQIFSDFDSIDLNNLDRIVVNPVKIDTSAHHKEV